jgi:hypothetical protein
VFVRTKRRRISFYAMPIVGLIGFLAVAKLAAWQRADVIAELDNRVSHGDTRVAAEAVRELSAMSNPPLTKLVTAAASDDHQVAQAAQESITRMLRRWQRQVENKNRLNTIGKQLTELAAALADQRQDFPTADHPWLSNTTHKILKLANKFPPQKSPLVAISCDAILTSIPDNEISAPPIANSPGATDDDMPHSHSTTPASEPDARDDRHAQLEHAFSAFGVEQRERANAGGTQSSQSNEATK